jgi:hypothetical protein
MNVMWTHLTLFRDGFIFRYGVWFYNDSTAHTMTVYATEQAIISEDTADDFLSSKCQKWTHIDYFIFFPPSRPLFISPLLSFS